MSCDIRMVNELSVPTLALSTCSSILQPKAALGTLDINEQAGQ